MDSKSLVICDFEEPYAQALAYYIMNRRGVHFQVHVCSELRYAPEADVLLISDLYPEEEREMMQAEITLLLSAEMMDESYENQIYKYQPGEQILDEILRKCELVYARRSMYCASSKKGKLIGVFSPVHRIGKTSYALRLGEQLAAAGNTLYLNLELYGGIGGHFEKGGQTMEDVLYYARQEQGNLGFMITKMTKKRGNLDYILPVTVSEELKRVRAEEWEDILDQIMGQSIYETIVLDIDEGLPELYDLLDLCDEIHLLSDDTYYSKAKIAQFEKELMMLGYESILDRVIREVIS